MNEGVSVRSSLIDLCSLDEYSNQDNSISAKKNKKNDFIF